MLGDYLAWTLQSRTIGHQFHVEAKGVTRFGLTHVGIKGVTLPVPPLSEQADIVCYLDEITADIATVIDRAHCQINLLQEYRTRLIADVVTGKLDVREASAALPEVDPLADEEALHDPDPGTDDSELALSAEEVGA